MADRHEIMSSVEVSDLSARHLYFDQKKNIFKWTSSFDNLRLFCKNHLNLLDNNSVVSLGNRLNSIKGKNLSINFYINTGTVQVQGKDSKAVKEKLLTYTDPGRVNYVRDEGELSIREFHESVHESSSKNNDFASVNGNNDESSYSLDNTFLDAFGGESGNDASFKMTQVELSKIWNAITDLKSTVSSSNSKTAKLDSQQNELEKCKNQIIELEQEKNCLLDEARKRISQLESENKSLLEVIKLLGNDQYSNSPPNLTCYQGNDDKEVVIISPSSTSNPYSNTNQAKDQRTTNNNKSKRKKNKKKRKSLNNDVTNQNEPSSTSTSTTQPTPSTGVNTNLQSSAQRKSLTIVGDSMLSKLEGWKMSNKDLKVKVRSFSGSTVDDMKDYIRPTLRESPDHIAVHVGTNNLHNYSSKSITDSIVDICTEIERSSSSSNKLFLS